MTETFYDLLGVADDATTDEIESAYREAIKEVHPDVSDDVDASERTARLNKAKDVLTDEQERARYDRVGHERYVSGGVDPGPGAAGANGSGTDSATGGAAGESSTGNSRSGGSTATGSAGGASGGSGGRWQDDFNFDPEGPTWSGRDPRRTRGSGRARSGPVGSGRDRSGTTRDRTDYGRRSTKGPWETDAGTPGSTSAQRQASAGTTSGSDVGGSWNAWDTSRAWAVHRETGSGQPLAVSRLFPPQQSVILLGSTFLLYPFFVFSMLFPGFPLFARFLVMICTALMLMYLLSIPEAAILVFGLWSLLAPIGLVAIPALSVFSLFGVVSLLATWVPFGFSVLTFWVVRPV